MPFFAWFSEFLGRARPQHYAVIPSGLDIADDPEGGIRLREDPIRIGNNRGRLLSNGRRQMPADTFATLPLYDPERTRRGNAYFGQEPYNYRKYASAKVVPLDVETNGQGATLIQIPKLKRGQGAGGPEFDFSKGSGRDPRRLMLRLPRDDISESPVLATSHCHPPGAPWWGRRQVEVISNIYHYNRSGGGGDSGVPRYYATMVALKGRLRWSLCRCRFRPVNPDIMIPKSKDQVFYVRGAGARVHVVQARYAPTEYWFPPGSRIGPHNDENPARPGQPQLRRFIVFTRCPSCDPGPAIFDKPFFRRVLSQSNRLRLRRLFTRGYDQADLGNLVAFAQVQEPRGHAAFRFYNGRYDNCTEFRLPVYRSEYWVLFRPVIPDPYQERFRKWIKGVTTQARGVRDTLLYPLDLLQHYRILPRAQNYYISPLDNIIPEPGNQPINIYYDSAKYHPLPRVRYLTFSGLPAALLRPRPQPTEVRETHPQPTEVRETHPRPTSEIELFSFTSDLRAGLLAQFVEQVHLPPREHQVVDLPPEDQLRPGNSSESRPELLQVVD